MLAQHSAKSQTVAACSPGSESQSNLHTAHLLMSCTVCVRLKRPVSLLPSDNRICSVVVGCDSLTPVEACCAGAAGPDPVGTPPEHTYR